MFPYIIASTIIHWGYYYFLNTGYRVGDLSLVYPVARGVAPLLVAVPAFIWLGEALPVMAWAGMICISAGILILGLCRAGKGPPVPALIMALLTGGTIALYTLVDGVGVRLAGVARGCRVRGVHPPTVGPLHIGVERRELAAAGDRQHEENRKTRAMHRHLAKTRAPYTFAYACVCKTRKVHSAERSCTLREHRLLFW